MSWIFINIPQVCYLFNFRKPKFQICSLYLSYIWVADERLPISNQQFFPRNCLKKLRLKSLRLECYHNFSLHYIQKLIYISNRKNQIQEIKHPKAKFEHNSNFLLSKPKNRKSTPGQTENFLWCLARPSGLGIKELMLAPREWRLISCNIWSPYWSYFSGFLHF